MNKHTENCASWGRSIDVCDCIKKTIEEHICRFNDGEQSCDCYQAGLADGLTRAKELMPGEAEVYGDWSEGRSDFREETLAAIEEEIRKVKGE